MATSQPTQGNSTSTVLGRRLGGELTRLRTTADLRQPHAAKALTASTTKIAKMEGGWVPMRDPDIRALCELYGVHDPAVVGGLLELARLDRERRKARGWWSEFPGIGAIQEYVALECAATTITTWQLAFVPGLLQAPEYVRALNPNESCAGAQPGMGCAFNVLSFAEPGAMDVVYMEIPRNELWHEGGEEAGVYGAMFENIERNALSAEESLAPITSLSTEL
ncbi:Scr1 family TA system antitoxin-like transcriptional regulator [Streptomyces sp. NPDC018045]|uniref:Scr1 family TA system antitoxin-like transcriptional regulator n=1 Tax=Streptomyces sp. NPDC018045 TaxID=3365037 RepID=UPI0037AB9FC5